MKKTNYLLILAIAAFFVACNSNNDQAHAPSTSAAELHAKFTQATERKAFSEAIASAAVLLKNYPDSNDAEAVKAALPDVQAAQEQQLESNKMEVRSLIASMKTYKDKFSHATSYYAEPSSGIATSNVSLQIVRSSDASVTLLVDLRYGHDGWIFWKDVQFSVDGKTIVDDAFLNLRPKRDVLEGSFVTESAFLPVNDLQLPLFDALAEGKTVLVRYTGRDQFDFELDSNRKDNIRRILRLYRLLKNGTPVT